MTTYDRKRNAGRCRGSSGGEVRASEGPTLVTDGVEIVLSFELRDLRQENGNEISSVTSRSAHRGAHAMLAR